MNRDDIRRAFYRDVADILSKDDDLMPSEFADDSRESKAWIAARDALVDELQRRGTARPK